MLLDVSAIQAGTLAITLQEADLTPLLLQAVATARSGAPQRTIVVSSLETLVLSIDPRRLQQVFNNLVENAIRSPRQS